MIRALRLLALFTALLAVSVRCLSGLPLAAACAIWADSSESQVAPLSDEPRDNDALAVVELDDSDDDADVVIAPSEPRILVLSHAESSGVDHVALVADRALSSHARGLDRPPRA